MASRFGTLGVLVQIAGMPRSGSTFTFNIVRQLLLARGTVVTPHTDRLAEALANQPADHWICKGHTPDPDMIALIRVGAASAICSIRKPEDSVLSWRYAFGFELDEVIGFIEKWLTTFEAYGDHALIIPFDEVEARPDLVVRRIAAHLGIRLRFREVARILRLVGKEATRKLLSDLEAGEREAHDMGYSRMDAETYFHTRHIADDRDNFESDPETIRTIRARLARWIDADGNLKPRIGPVALRSDAA